MRITVGAPKGGAGKTTSSAHLGINFSKYGRTKIVDCDPEQHQVVDWANRAEDWPVDRCIVVPEATRNLARNMAPQIADFEHVIFDMGAKNTNLLRQAMSLSDYLIVPSKGTDGDLLELPKVFEIAEEVDITHPIRPVVLLTMIRGGTREEEDARAYLAELGLPVFRTVIPLLRHLGDMRSTPPEFGEYADLVDELLEMDKEVRA